MPMYSPDHQYPMQSFLRDFLLSILSGELSKTWRPSSQLRALRAERGAEWPNCCDDVKVSIVQSSTSLICALSVGMAPHMEGESTGKRPSRPCSARVPIRSLVISSRPCLSRAVRFIGSFVTAENCPQPAVFAFFKLSDSIDNDQAATHGLSGGGCSGTTSSRSRRRIASAAVKAGWNSRVTIGIDGQWVEVEREEHAQPPRRYVDFPRPAPPGRSCAAIRNTRSVLLELSGRNAGWRSYLTQKSALHLPPEVTIRNQTQTMATSIARIVRRSSGIKAAGGILQRRHSAAMK